MDGQTVEQIGDFAVHRVIGEGGMGVVYEATERLSGRKVALKVLNRSLTQSPDARARFFNEMRIMAGLEHPNIVRSLSNSEIDGKLVIVLEYLEGRTLRDELDARGRLPPSRAIAIAKDIASALVSAHGMKTPIVHRDLKPENLMLLKDGRVKVMDFGVAKVLGDKPGMTQQTQAVGTVQYFSPEQAESGTITPRTDLYALGLVLYEMLSGRPPFTSGSILQLLKQHAEAPPPPLPEEVRNQTPAVLETLLLSLLAKSPDDRPGDAAMVLQMLEALGPATSATSSGLTLPMPLGLPKAATSAAPTPATTKPRKADTIELLNRFESKRKRNILIGLVAAVVVAAIAVPWVLFVQERNRPKPKAKATAAVTATAAPTSAPAPVDTQRVLAAIPEADPCKDKEVCIAFTPSATTLEAETLLAQVETQLRGVDPTIRLVRGNFDEVLVNGLVNTTLPKARIDLVYATATGELRVEVTPNKLLGRRGPFYTQPDLLPPIRCTLKRAFDAAGGAGFPFNISSSASVQSSFQGGTAWNFSSESGGIKQHGRVEGDDCKVRFKLQKIDFK